MSAVMDVAPTRRAAYLRAIKTAVTLRLLDIGTDRARVLTLAQAYREYDEGYGVDACTYRAVQRVRERAIR